jgi:hypothetical protein
MRKLRLLPLIGLLFLAAAFSLIAGRSVQGQTAAGQRLSPKALVADLYRVHNLKRSPFFQTRSRALLDEYFEKGLADLIWKDAVRSKGEVGALDGDPLYNAQDFEITNFAIGKPSYVEGKAKVVVTFENFGKPKTIVFIMVNGRAGWRINDIDWTDGNTLRGILKGETPKS